MADATPEQQPGHADLHPAAEAVRQGGSDSAPAEGRIALAEDVIRGGLVGARHLRRMPAPVGAQLLGQSLVALQVRLRGLRSSMKTPSYSRKSLIERSM